MSSAKKKHRFLNVLFVLLVTIVTVWLVVASAYLVLRTLASQEGKLPAVFGYQISAETEQGMGNLVPQGSVVLSVEKPNLAVNDIVLYRRENGGYRSGRIQKILSFEEDPEYNVVYNLSENESEKVLRSAIVGQIVYTIPYAGYVVDYLATFNGVLYAVLIPCGVLIVLLVVRILVSFRGRHSDEDEEEDFSSFHPSVSIEPEVDTELAAQNEELDRVWQKNVPSGRPETEAITTDQDMIFELSNMNNRFASEQPQNQQYVQDEAERIVSEINVVGSGETESLPASERLSQTEKTVHELEHRENKLDYDQLIATLGLEEQESSDLVSLLRQYGIQQDEIDAVQKASPFIKPVVTDHSVDVDLTHRPAQKVSVVSDEHGKFLIIESENVETKIRLPFE